VEVGAESVGEKPGGNVEIFVMGLGEAAAPGAGFVEGGWGRGDAVVRGKGGPALFEQSMSGDIDIDRHGFRGTQPPF
jgi:hypothetical protein